jgi:SAM-dependent methyltransferase
MADRGSDGLFSPFLRSQRFKAARPYIGKRVLDMGCGMGDLASMVPADSYVGVDIDGPSLAIARKQHPQHHFQSALPPAELKFDTVVALAVIEHVPDPGLFLRELAARLDSGPDRFIVCTTPYPVIGWVLTAGAKFGLFDRHANEEHKDLLDHTRIEGLVVECDLKLVVYHRFLFGANQVLVFQKNREPA